VQRIAFIYSSIDKALQFEWLLTRFKEKGLHIQVIILNPGDSAIEQFCVANNIKVERITYQGKKDLPKSTWQIRKILRKDKINIVHTHLFDATFAGLIAAKLAGVKTRIYTRHHSSRNHKYNKKMVKFDKLFNRLSTTVIAISENVKEVLMRMEGLSDHKIEVIHHGLELSTFTDTDSDKVAALAKKYNTEEFHPVVGVISRYLHLKGLQYIIPAFIEFRGQYPKAKLVLANANGDFKDEVQRMLSALPEDAYKEIAFEKDLGSLYQLFDLFIHAPIDNDVEAFGQIYTEALAAGIPSVFTLSGVAKEFMEDRQNALIVPYKDKNAIVQSLLELMSDSALKEKIIQNGRLSVNQFTADQCALQHINLYAEGNNV